MLSIPMTDGETIASDVPDGAGHDGREARGTRRMRRSSESGAMKRL